MNENNKNTDVDDYILHERRWPCGLGGGLLILEVSFASITMFGICSSILNKNNNDTNTGKFRNNNNTIVDEYFLTARL